MAPGGGACRGGGARRGRHTRRNRARAVVRRETHRGGRGARGRAAERGGGRHAKAGPRGLSVTRATGGGSGLASGGGSHPCDRGCKRSGAAQRGVQQDTALVAVVCPVWPRDVFFFFFPPPPLLPPFPAPLGKSLATLYTLRMAAVGKCRSRSPERVYVTPPPGVLTGRCTSTCLQRPCRCPRVDTPSAARASQPLW